MNLKNILGEKQDQKVRTKELRSRIQGENWSPTEVLWTTKPPLPIWSPNTTKTPQCPKSTRENLHNSSTWIWPLWPFMIIKVNAVAPVFIYQGFAAPPFCINHAWEGGHLGRVQPALERGTGIWNRCHPLSTWVKSQKVLPHLCLKGRKTPFWVHFFFEESPFYSSYWSCQIFFKACYKWMNLWRGCWLTGKSLLGMDLTSQPCIANFPTNSSFMDGFFQPPCINSCWKHLGIDHLE